MADSDSNFDPSEVEVEYEEDIIIPLDHDVEEIEEYDEENEVEYEEEVGDMEWEMWVTMNTLQQRNACLSQELKFKNRTFTTKIKDRCLFLIAQMNERDEVEWPEEFLINLPIIDIFGYEPINHEVYNEHLVQGENQNNAILIEDSDSEEYLHGLQSPFPWDAPEFIPPLAVMNEQPEDAESGITIINEVLIPSELSQADFNFLLAQINESNHQTMIVQEQVDAQHAYTMHLENELGQAQRNNERLAQMLELTQAQLNYTQEELARSYQENSCLTSELLGDPYMEGYTRRRMAGRQMNTRRITRNNEDNNTSPRQNRQESPEEIDTATEISRGIQESLPSIIAQIQTAMNQNSEHGGVVENQARTGANNGQTHGCDYKAFINASPSMFEGKDRPIAAMNWLDDMESCFQTCQCALTQQVRFASTKLKRNALHW
ncbi:hypothetical protein OSB04_032010 [Centaurea solstitialis]|uniref:Reverse transcriptase domain-containing protein n=1 Tax=Centaurea solstitialis TaxID=347529 RepID=A0AA38SU61_9ASTR|nr:hypothetical protein OSB04_032010 [Centaurea solstitialis]